MIDYRAQISQAGEQEYQRGKWQWKVDQHKSSGGPGGVEGLLEWRYKTWAGKISNWRHEGDIMDGL